MKMMRHVLAVTAVGKHMVTAEVTAHKKRPVAVHSETLAMCSLEGVYSICSHVPREGNKSIKSNRASV